MAFGIKQIHPNDLRASVAIGVGIPFNGKGVFTQNFQTKDALRNNLINYFLTNPGERVGNPSFGSGIRKFIFNQISDNNLDFLKEDLQMKIVNNFPQILLNKIEIKTNPDFNEINVVINYSIRNTNINDQIKLNFR